MFSEEKVTQMAAYFLLQSNRQMPYIKLIKLLYLSDRVALGKRGKSLSGDRFVSMPHGPVLSQTYDLIKGCGQQNHPWQCTIKDEANYNVSLADGFDIDDIDELSRADIRVLDEVFAEFGEMKPFDLVDYTHEHCKEWRDPEGSSFPINPEAIFRALGKNESEVASLVEKYQEEQALDEVRAALR
ncbi:Panacea domain-containing protein [Vibrio cholerae]|uniref:Panacea domain-containing protein n=1 Tax=Vibrio cholerae TaxID=666 RepID=UPI00165D91F2|nr:Panacea domain-containing protein [Vibrio cholerae]